MVETEEVRTVNKKKLGKIQLSVAERASPKGVYFINFNQGGIRKIHINIFNINIYITFGRYFCDSAVGRSKDFKWALEIWAKSYGAKMGGSDYFPPGGSMKKPCTYCMYNSVYTF